MKQKTLPDIINIGGGRETNIAELAKIIRTALGFKGKIIFDTSKPDGNPKRFLDSSKINSLGWNAKTPLEDGLKMTYDWYKTIIKRTSNKNK